MEALMSNENDILHYILKPSILISMIIFSEFEN